MSEFDPYAVEYKVRIPQADQQLFEEFAITGMTLTESLLSPTLETKIYINSYRHNNYVKDWDKLNDLPVKISMWRDMLKSYNKNHRLDVEQRIYAVKERRPTGAQNDAFVICAIDESALMNATRRMSKSWKCTSPTEIVEAALSGCVKIPNDRLFTEPSTPPRTFFAENIHPYQVVAQQADVALANNNDPSFLHYMTFENIKGTHRFESLYKMTRKNSIWAYEFKEKGKPVGSDDIENWHDPYAILSYENPCDFDILSDAMNGFDANGINRSSLMTINPFNGIHSIYGGDNSDCGMGGQVGETAFTNKGSAENEPNCEIDVEKHKLTRQARLGLLDSGMAQFRCTVAFNPNLHVGKIIYLETHNLVHLPNGEINIRPDYASGYYLISALTHKFHSTVVGYTTMDCISTTVGNKGATLGPEDAKSKPNDGRYEDVGTP